MKRRVLYAFLSIAFLASFLLGSPALTATAATIPDASSSTMLQATNLQREQNGLGDLYFNYRLTSAAQAKAADMAANDYWAHVSPSGVQPWDFISQSGYNYHGAGENLAYGYSTLSEVITGWMNSPEHRANMLGNYVDVGFGFYTATNYQGSGPQTIVVAEFGLPTDAPAPAPAPAAQAETAAPQAAPAATQKAVVAELASEPVAASPTPAANAAAPVAVPSAVKTSVHAHAAAPAKPASSEKHLLSWPQSLVVLGSLSAPRFFLSRRR
ncbi:MAG: CAP domain-containing protein [Patescibacteria group bacterium]|nr:CAP domain-containing protein [Patescibacteria group bacterium]